MPQRNPPSGFRVVGGINTPNPVRPVKARVLRMPRMGNGTDPQPPDGAGNVSGMRPKERVLATMGGMLRRQFQEADGNLHVLAKRHGARVSVLGAIIAKEMKEAA